jgi:hypothetical protein
MSRTRKPRVPREDFFATPAWVVRAILPHLPHAYEAFDPCAGEGAILRVMASSGLAVRGIESNPERAREANVAHADAFAVDWGRPPPPLVVMNPPFSQAEAFVRRALQQVAPGGTVAALLPLPFLTSEERIAFHASHACDVFVLPRRPSFTADGKTDSVSYMWALFGPGRGGRWMVLETEPGPKRRRGA